MEVNIHQAKTHLSKLLWRTMEGEEIIITRAVVPIARLVSVDREKARRPMDLERDVYELPGDFDAPLPSEVAVLFEGKALPKTDRAKRKGRAKRS